MQVFRVVRFKCAETVLVSVTMALRTVLRHPRVGAFAVRGQRRSVSHHLSLDSLNPNLAKHRRTKIICTVGPASWEEDGMKSLLNAGMNVMRINCSHGDHELYKNLIERLRNVAKEHDASDLLAGWGSTVSCAIALDTKGPEIRLGDFTGDDVSRKVTINAGDEIKLFTNENRRTCMTESEFFVDYASISSCVKPGTSKIYIDDGLLSLSVTSVDKDDEGLDVVKTVADNTATIGSRKGVNLPGAVLDLPAVSEKDKEDLRFARENGVDFIFASFIRKQEHVEEIRSIVGPDVGIVSKIENAEGIDNIDGIIRSSDGIMVARGDLGIEIPQENVFLAQKMIAAKCNILGKPLITATQMLDSMTRSPRPTRAECGDVANAVLDGSDAVMLSGETANGLYPEMTVRTMSKICQTAEYSMSYRRTMEYIKEAIRRNTGGAAKPICEALVLSAVVASFEEKAKIIFINTETGISAKIAAKYRPYALIVCITSNEALGRRLQLCHGLKVFVVPKGMEQHEAVSSAIRHAYHKKLAEPGEMVVSVDAKNQHMRLHCVPEWVATDSI